MPSGGKGLNMKISDALYILNRKKNDEASAAATAAHAVRLFGLALLGAVVLAPSLDAKAAGEVSVTASGGSSAEYVCDSLSEAFDYIKNGASSAYEISLSGDLTESVSGKIADIKVPATGKNITIDAAGNAISFGSKLTLEGNLAFENAVLKPSKALAVKLGNNTLSFDKVKVEGGIASVAGSGTGSDTAKFKSKFNITNSDITLTGKLTKVENVSIVDASLVSYGASSYYAVTTSGTAVLGGGGAFRYAKDGTLSSAKGNITITGPLKKKGGTLSLELYMKEKDGSYSNITGTFDDQLEKSAALAKTGIIFGKMPNVPSESFDLEAGAEGRFVKNGGSLYYGTMSGGYILSYEEDGDVKTSEAASFAGLVSEINAMKTAREYSIIITPDAQETSKNTPDKLVGPTDKNASLLTISGGDYGADLYYTGKITLKCPAVLDNIGFKLTNKGNAYGENDTPKAVTATFGNYVTVTERGARFNSPIKLSAKGTLDLRGSLETATAGLHGVFSGAVSAMDIEMTDCALDVVGTITTRNLTFNNTDGADAIHLGATGAFNVNAAIKNDLVADEGDSIILVTKAKKKDNSKGTISTPNLAMLGSYSASEEAPDIYIGILESDNFIDGEYRTPRAGDVIFRLKSMRKADVDRFRMLFENQGVLGDDSITGITKDEALAVFTVSDLNVIYPEY